MHPESEVVEMLKAYKGLLETLVEIRVARNEIGERCYAGSAVCKELGKKYDVYRRQIPVHILHKLGE